MRATKDRAILIVWLIALLAVPFAFAHLAAGQDIEVDGFLIDMGHDPEFINAGEPFTLMMTISNATTQEQLDPRKVWIRIMKEEGGIEQVAFAGTFSPEARSVTTVMSLPKEGIYTMDVRFFGEGPKAWAAAEFPLTIQMKKASGMLMVWIIAGLGMSVFLIIIYVWWKARTTPYPLHSNKNNGKNNEDEKS
jgi:hypothetical protein